MDVGMITEIASVASNLVGSAGSSTKTDGSSSSGLASIFSSTGDDKSNGNILNLPTIASVLSGGEKDSGDSEKICDGQKSIFGIVGKVIGGIVGTFFGGPAGTSLGSTIGGFAGNQASDDTDAIISLFS